MGIVVLCLSMSSCSDNDEPKPSEVVKCKVTCEVEYPETCKTGETIEVKLLSVKVEAIDAENAKAPYVREVVFWTHGDDRTSQQKAWDGKPLVFRTKVEKNTGITLDIGFVFIMSDNIQTYTSKNYYIKVVR